MKYDIIIIGGGVAGLTAAVYTRLANKSVLIIENSIIGGNVASLEKVRNYPGFNEIQGMDLVQKIYLQALNLGAEFVFDNILKIDFENHIIDLKDNQFEYLSLIIASGSSYKKLNVNNEDTFCQKGISYCAVCDGNLYKNKKIIVITNNLSANYSIDYLSNITKDITILNIGNTEIPYENAINNVQIQSFNGDTKLNSVTYTQNNQNYDIQCDGCFISLGKESNLELYKDNIDIANGSIVSDERMRTNIEGVFVAGDIRNTPLRQIVTACADGAIASTEAVKYVQIKKKV